jgi:hypothetical protein
VRIIIHDDPTTAVRVLISMLSGVFSPTLINIRIHLEVKLVLEF